jgi:hypothetical protein
MKRKFETELAGAARKAEAVKRQPGEKPAQRERFSISHRPARQASLFGKMRCGAANGGAGARGRIKQRGIC